MWRCRLLVLAVMTSWLAVLGAARADVLVEIVDTDPPGEAVSIGRDEPFYVRIEYATDEPIRIWARPYVQGTAVVAAKTNASLTHSGHGYALGWFSLDGAAEVDEIRILVGGGTPWREWQAARYPVKITGTGLPAAPRAKAAWVDELLGAEAAARRQQYEQRMSEPVSATERMLMSGFMLAVLALLLAGLALPAWGLWRWRGGWRVAAAVPAALMAFVVLRIVMDTAHDPTSHNLWPFEILQSAVISLALMAALKIARLVAHRRN